MFYSSKYPTFFISAKSSIEENEKKYQIPSENWPYPTDYRFGDINDKYYAEIWIDGMDWNINYWILEMYKYEPKSFPLLMLDDRSIEGLFNLSDLRNLFMGIIWYRRYKDYSKFNDILWPYINHISGEKKIYSSKDNVIVFYKYYMKHASQKLVTFWVNKKFMPKL